MDQAHIILTAIFILLGGILVRADGWGGPTEPGAPAWQKSIAHFFSGWTCSVVFAFLTLAYTLDFYAFVPAFIAYAAWRVPGFNGWQKWWHMFWRGAWTSAIGFTLLSVVMRNTADYGYLFIAMGAAEALAYSGSYKWLPGRVPDWAVHVTAEISSGLAFTALVAVILN